MHFDEILKKALGSYEFTDLNAYAIKFFLRNPYESVVIVNKEDRYEYMDRGSEKLFGLPEGGAKGIRSSDLMPKSLLPKVLETSAPIIGGVIDINGQRKLASIFPLIQDGKLIGAMGRLILHSLDELDRINRQTSRLREEVKSLRRREKQHHIALYTFQNILGVSTNVKECIELAKKAAITRSDVLISGQSGTGKELFAHAIHNFLDPGRPFVSVNSPAVPFELAESELFGYAKGAFSGALAEGKQGKFELANNGTLFLDEVAALPLSLQAKLLRTLQEREIEMVGGTSTKKVNFQLISATNIDLKKLVNQGRFRSDLYYRLAKIMIHIDPLRERTEDIPVLADHFLELINSRFRTRFEGFSNEAINCLKNYEWLGNTRELINVLERTCLKKWEGRVITMECLPPEVIQRHSVDRSPQLMGFKETKQKTEKRMILDALEKTGGNRRKAAFLMGMPRSTFYNKMKDFDIE